VKKPIFDVGILSQARLCAVRWGSLALNVGRKFAETTERI
jgi:hypothetical protein